MKKIFFTLAVASSLAWCATNARAQTGSGTSGAGSTLPNPGQSSNQSLGQPNLGRPDTMVPSQGVAQPNPSLPSGQTGANFQGSGQSRTALPNNAPAGANAGGPANIQFNGPGVGVTVDPNRGGPANPDLLRQGQGGDNSSSRLNPGDSQRGPNINIGNDNWRMVRYNGEWWYWTPQNTWMFHRDNNWQAYEAGTFRPLQRYRTAFRGLNQNMDERREARDVIRDQRQDVRDTARDTRMENRDQRQDLRQDTRDLRQDQLPGTRDQIQQNRDNLQEQRQDARQNIQDQRQELRQDLQQNRLNNAPSPTPGSGTQIPSLPTPGTTNTDGSIGGAAGGN
jgi:gas vesicle protein